MAERTVSYVFKGVFTSLTGGLAVAGKSTKDFGDKLTALDKQGAKTRAGLKTVGDTAGKIGLVAAAGLGAIVVATANFDKAMSGVQAATHETAQNMEELRQAAIKAGADTAFSASEAAAGIENLAKAGVTTKDILTGGLSGALDLAAAGQIEVADAAEIAASALTQFKLAGADIPHVADLLAAGAGKAQGSVSDMGMALNQSGLVAAQTGLTIEETTGTLAAFASAGLIGSDAGTSFKTMLQSLTPSGEKAAEAMDNLGIAAYDAQGNFIGMTEFAANLRDGLKDLSVEQQNAALKTIFGSDAVRAASVVFQQGGAGIQGWIDKVNDSGYAAETAAIQLDNLSGDLEAFKGSLETALIGAGGDTQGPLRELVQHATSVVNAFNGLPPAAQGSVTKVLGAVAILGGSIFVFSRVTQSVANTRLAMQQLEVTAGKTATALKALKVAGGIAAGMLILSEAIDQLERSTDKAAPGVEGLTSNLINLKPGNKNAIQGIVDDLGDLDAQIDSMSDLDVFAQIEGFYDRVPLGIGKLEHAVPILGGKLTEAARVARVTAQSFDSIDSALAGLVSQGHPEQATAALDSLAEAYGLTDDQVNVLKEHLPQYDEALAGAANSSQLAAGASGDLSGALGTEAEATRNAEAAAKKHAAALQASRDAARTTAKGFVGLADSLDDSKVSLRQWLRDLEKQADALRNFRLNAKKAAKQGLDDGLIKSLEAAGPAGALRMKQLANATDTEIARANKAWRRGQREINLYTDAVGGAKAAGPVNTQVNAKTETAVGKLNYFQQLLRGLDGDTVTTHVKTIADRPVITRATGGSVFGPGTETSDSIDAKLSTNEHVWSAREVRGAGGHAAMERMRAMARYGELPRFRDGGAVRPYDAPRFADGGRVAQYMHTSSRPSGSSSMVVTGTLQTPWGPAHIEGIARDVARQEIDADASYNAGLERMRG